jgi:hypothetical protein
VDFFVDVTQSPELYTRFVNARMFIGWQRAKYHGYKKGVNGVGHHIFTNVTFGNVDRLELTRAEVSQLKKQGLLRETLEDADTDVEGVSQNSPMSSAHTHNQWSSS